MKIILIILILATPVLAEDYICTVERVGGPWQGKYYLTVTDEGDRFKHFMFNLPPNETNRMITIAIAAMGQGRKVQISLPEPITWDATIGRMYIIK